MLKGFTKYIYSSFVPHFFKSKIQTEYDFVVISTRVNLWGETKIRKTEYTDIDFKSVLNRFKADFGGKEPHLIRCKYDNIGNTLGSLGSNLSMTKIIAPSYSFVGSAEEA